VTSAIARKGAADLANAVAESVQYQGRKASRQGSEQRRQDILDAAIRIVVREGVRGVRHRAVAAEAAVPLSATTYYFKDIEDLLSDAFALYVERSAAYMAKFWAGTESLLRDLLARSDDSHVSRVWLAEEIARLTADYIQRRVLSRREQLLAEHAFRQEALLNPRLAELVRSHQCILLQGTCQMLEVLGSREPRQDAKVLTAIIGRMEYQALLGSKEEHPEAEMLATLTRFMLLVLASARD